MAAVTQAGGAFYTVKYLSPHQRYFSGMVSVPGTLDIYQNFVPSVDSSSHSCIREGKLFCVEAETLHIRGKSVVLELELPLTR
ncbi:uncharacterized protein CLUP02_05593 [Colletotrichum lupini]|uniref:Uncharacterized protein n=1 Tax=Colletotrichum lupini TaxID=145971 RepID=A0A9Q8SNM6_9PEZI|nr:uncharacterized protein CLUP02_05593 [Colletotrichum lupini]UQC80111.1 hypothetical protein CLUP02_05593 [Colletotrichum lupini]